jgi:hypothetical protein
MQKIFILVLVLIIAGCATSPIEKTGVSIKGTWSDSFERKWVFYEGDFEIINDENIFRKGTYTINDHRTITTQIELAFIAGDDYVFELPTGMYSRDKLQEVVVKGLVDYDIYDDLTIEEIQEVFESEFGRIFAVTINYYSVRDDTLLLDWYDWPVLLTRNN